MTVGTAIVICVALICVTFLATIGIGVYLTNKKKEAVNDLAAKILEKKNKI